MSPPAHSLPQTRIETKLAAWLESQVSERRYRHSLGVMEAVTRLTIRHGLDPHPLRLAALLHDSLRELPDEELLARAEEWSVPVRPVDRLAPVLLHGRLAVELAGRDFGISDPAMASAMGFHTAGHVRMSLADKLFFLADTIEENRRQAGVRALRDLADVDVDRALLTAVEASEQHLKAIGAVVDPETVRLRQVLKDEIGRR